MYQVYVVYNSAAKKYYIGQSTDASKRVIQHNDGTFKGYTSRFKGEWKLIYTESAATRSEALKREKQLKSFRGREYIKRYIPGFRQPADRREKVDPE